jgi:hypothetical protein
MKWAKVKELTRESVRPGSIEQQIGGSLDVLQM